MQKIAVVTGILAASLFSASIYANSYDRGLKLYRRADFKGAESAFLDVLRGGVNRATRSRVYKYIGLSQYMLGRKNEARASFHSALKYNPKIEIYPDDVFDSSLLEFFLQIKQDSKRGLRVVTSPPPRRTTAAKVAPPPITKKSASRKVVTAKPTKSGKQVLKGKRQVAKKKDKKGSLFTGKNKKPPRVIFSEKGKGNEQQTRSGQLLLPTGADGDSSDYEDSDWRLFLPFGVGQYLNDNYKLGHTFAAAGILTLGSFILHMYQLRGGQRTLDEHYEERDRQFKVLKERPLPEDKHNEHVAEWEATITEWSDYVNALKLYSYLSLAAFVAVWAGGAIEATLNRPAIQGYSLLVPKIHYSYDYQNHQLALLWQYQLP